MNPLTLNEVYRDTSSNGWIIYVMSWRSKHVMKRPIPVGFMETHKSVPPNSCLHYDVTGRNHVTIPYVNVDATLKCGAE